MSPKASDNVLDVCFLCNEGFWKGTGHEVKTTDEGLFTVICHRCWLEVNERSKHD